MDGTKTYVDYLVDPASSHMLVSKTKPCTSQYELKLSETANSSLNQSSFTGRKGDRRRITAEILELIHAIDDATIERSERSLY